MNSFLSVLDAPTGQVVQSLMAGTRTFNGSHLLGATSFFGLPESTVSTVGANFLNLVGAVLILALGWIISGAVAKFVQKALRKTQFDDRLTGFMVGGKKSSGITVETILMLATTWLIRLVAVVAALNVLQLNTVSQPINSLLTQILTFLPSLAGAIILGVVAWFVANLVKNLVMQSAESFDLDGKVNGASAENAVSPTETLANALYWLVFLFFLPVILGVLGLNGPLAPVQALLTDVLSALPRLLKAAGIAAVAWFVAQVVQNIVSNLLAAAGVDQMGRQVGLQSKPGQSLSSMGGLVVFTMIMIPGVIGALDALEIPALSGPASNMLRQILEKLPQVFTAGVVIFIANFIGTFVGELVSSLLSGFGFDDIPRILGLPAQAASPAYVENGEPAPAPQTPSGIMGVVVRVAIIAIAVLAATDILGLAGLKTLAEGLLAMAGQVLVGVLIFGIGLYIANLAANLIKSSGVAEANLLAQAARIAILVFSGAMALSRIGVAPEIVNLAFGLLLGAIAVAIAIAFGLGGRDVAGEELRNWVKPFKK
jgi:Conserved TM helix